MSMLTFVIKLDASPSHDQRLHVKIDGVPARLSQAVVAALVAGAVAEVTFDAATGMLLASYTFKSASDQDVLRFFEQGGGGRAHTVDEARKALAEAAQGNTL